MLWLQGFGADGEIAHGLLGSRELQGGESLVPAAASRDTLAGKFNVDGVPQLKLMR